MSSTVQRQFRLLWAGETASMFGTYISRLAVPLAAATLLAATPFQMGLLYAAQTVAFLVIGLPAGVLVDRWPAKWVLVTCDAVRALLVLSVPIAWLAGWLSLAQLLLVTLLTGVAAVFFDVAYQSCLPLLVGQDGLLEGNSKLESSRSVAQVAGPAIGGGLANLVTAANAIGAQTLCYATSAFVISRISGRLDLSSARPRRPMVPEIIAGLRYVLGDRLMRAVTACSATFNFWYAVSTPLLVLLLVDDAGLPQWEAGALMAFGGVGGVLGAVTTTRLSVRVGAARVLWLPFVVCMPVSLLVPLTVDGWGVLLFAVPWFFVSYGLIAYNVAQISFRQRMCPPELMSRMNATVRFVVWGLLPLGGVAGGVLGDWLGVRVALLLAGVGMTSSVGWILLSPLRSMREFPALTPAGQNDAR